ncbi:hypothetical protein GDO78_004690 [Eleutherodactylus coqui]|uniref:Uncharacterized protein n=1 Tax=Eleutherodactylus coqui TaxID=57060 RepID=A0A8J6K064_ELECQ|nr:hypothetical protein GDO78_004690 [Eleutherodactylus coqui]
MSTITQPTVPIAGNRCPLIGLASPPVTQTAALTPHLQRENWRKDPAHSIRGQTCAFGKLQKLQSPPQDYFYQSCIATVLQFVHVRSPFCASRRTHVAIILGCSRCSSVRRPWVFTPAITTIKQSQRNIHQLPCFLMVSTQMFTLRSCREYISSL